MTKMKVTIGAVLTAVSFIISTVAIVANTSFVPLTVFLVGILGTSFMIVGITENIKRKAIIKRYTEYRDKKVLIFRDDEKYEEWLVNNSKVDEDE